MDDRLNQVLTRTTNNKARSELAAFFSTLDEVDAYAEPEDECRNDDNDGVAACLADDIRAAHRKKLDSLIRSNMFEPSEQIPNTEQARSEPKTDANSINAKGRYGYTLLHQAVLDNDGSEVSRLIAAGALWNIRDNGGQTAWDKAYNRGYDGLLLMMDPGFVRTEPVECLED